MTTTQRSVPVLTLPSREEIPLLGQGTRGMAEDPHRRDVEIATLRAAIDLGLTMIDTADDYAGGATQRLIGEAVASQRDDVFLVTRLTPGVGTRAATVAACEQSLRRFGTDRIDLCLLRPATTAALDEMVEACTALMTQGGIRHWGVVDVDLSGLAGLTGVPGGTAVEIDQVRYNLACRGIEWELLPRCREAGLPVMAYAPLDRGRLLDHPALGELSARYGVHPAQVALAWLLGRDGVCAVAGAHTPEKVARNRAALELPLTADDLATLERAFPAPTGPRPLDRI